MPFTLRPFHRFSMQRSVTYNVGPFQGQGTVWNLSSSGWRIAGNLPVRQGETLSLTATLLNEQRIEGAKAAVRWRIERTFAIKTAATRPQTEAQLFTACRFSQRTGHPMLAETNLATGLQWDSEQRYNHGVRWLSCTSMQIRRERALL